MVETLFVPRGAEERAVRSALAQSPIRIVAMGIGPRAAARAAETALAEAPFRSAVVVGLCGTLSASFVVGDTLVYDEIRSPSAGPLALDRALARSLAARIAGAQSGIRAVHSDRIVTRSSDKRALGVRFDAQAVDMESYAIAERLERAGIATGVVRVASDAVNDDLPDLDRALDGSGGIDDSAMALAFVRSPVASVRLIANAMKSLRALRESIALLAAAS